MREEAISARQFAALALFVTLGDSLVILPGTMVSLAKQDAWLSMVVGLAAGLPVMLLFLAVYARGAATSPVAKLKQICGPWFGGLFILPYIAFALFLSAGSMRILGDFMITQIMPETPGTAVVALLLAVAVAAIRGGVEAFARAGEVLLLCFLFVFFFFILTLVPQADLHRLLPVWENGPGPVAHGGLLSLSFCFIEIMPLMMLMPHVKANSRKEMRRALLFGAIAGGCALLIVTLLCITVLGPGHAERHMYPTYTLAKKISVGSFLERMEAMIAFMWIISTFVKLGVNLFAIHLGLAQWIGSRSYRTLAVPVAVVTLALGANFTDNMAYFHHIVTLAWPIYDLTMLFVPLLLLGLLVVRKAGKRG